MHEFFQYLPLDANSGLGIPYLPRQGSTGIIEYVDLKRDPARIPSVRELKDRPELQKFVATLNGPTSLFRTLRCEHRCTCVPGASTMYQTHWHFTFAFEIVEQNHAESYDLLSRLLHRYLQMAKKDSTLAFDVRKIPTSYRDHGVTLWSQDIEVYGFGQNESESEREFIYALRLLRNFFSAESKKWAGELAKGRVTIS